MSGAGGESDLSEGEIERKSLAELVRALDKAEDGSYTFLIGAGVSRPLPAEIPTASELIAEFKEDRYEDEQTELDLEDWAEDYRDVSEDKAYGFWFSEVYPTPGNRRERIREMVDKPDVEPPFGQIVLASMMDDGIISHTFTPNFDDLLFDAFYDFSEQRPLFVDHEAKAKQFIMSGDRPAIVKLHGDYLHYTQNTTGETSELDPNIEDRFQQSLGEYGMIVVGYGGRDDSIMNVLEAEESFSEYGLFWCVREEDEVHDRVEDLMADSENAYIVEIEGSENFFKTLWYEIDRVELPQPAEIMERAERRRDRISKRKAEVGSKQVPKNASEDSVNNPKSKIWDAQNLRADGEHEAAMEVLNEVIRENPNLFKAYYERGRLKAELEMDEEAVDDLNRALQINPIDYNSYNERGIAKKNLGDYRDAIKDFSEAIERKPNFAPAYTNRGRARQLAGEYEIALKDHNKALEIGPEFPEAYNNRGLVKRERGKKKAALKDFTEAKNLDPSDPIYSQNLSEMNIILGKFERGRQHAQKAETVSDSNENQAVSLLLNAISTIMLDEDLGDIEEKYQNLCEKDFSTSWSLNGLETWMEETKINQENQKRIAELLDLLREHKDE